MRFTNKIIAIALTTSVLFSCGTEEVIEDTPVVDTDVALVDLTQYELPYVLKTSKKDDEINPIDVIHEEGDIEWVITKGAGFDLIVEDYGDESINAEEVLKRQEAVDQVFEIKYQDKSPTLVKYSESIPGDANNTAFHFYMVKEYGEGYFYTFRSNPTEKFTQEQVEKMVKAVSLLTVADSSKLPRI